MIPLKTQYTEAVPNGFSLIEAVAALSLLSIISLSFFGSIILLARQATENEIRGGAIQAGQRVLDELRLEDPESLPSASGASVDYEVAIAGRKHPFMVDVHFCEDPSLCEVKTTRQIEIEVLYQGVKRFSAETVFTRLR